MVKMNDTWHDEVASNSSVNVTLLDVNLFFKPQPVLITLYLSIIIVSLAANILLIIIVTKYHYMRNVTNLFLVNLSVADLLVTVICMPVQLSKAFTLIWFYGEVFCKMVNYLQGVAVAASIFTIAAMSVDRYLVIAPASIVRPPNKKIASILIGTLWLAALLIFTPILAVATVHQESIPLFSPQNNNTDSVELCFCTENWNTSSSRRNFGTLSFALVYAIPGSITIFSYIFMGKNLCSLKPPYDTSSAGNVSMQQSARLIKERKRVAWILPLLAILFAVCWLPYNILLLMLDMNSVPTEIASSVLPYALLLGHANSAINPVVYCLVTKNFQRSARKLICGSKQTQKKFLCNRVCGRRRDMSSTAPYDSYHQPHKRCYLHMRTFGRDSPGHTHNYNTTDSRIQTTRRGTSSRSSKRIIKSGNVVILHRPSCTLRY